MMWLDTSMSCGRWLTKMLCVLRAATCVASAWLGLGLGVGLELGLGLGLKLG